MSKYIDAEKLERFFNRDEWDTPDERWRPESEFGRFVDALPTEDVAPVVHAHWIDCKGRPVELLPDGWTPQGSYGLCCSHCHEDLEATDWQPVDGKYCPNCGAKMDEKGEENETE